MHDARIATTVIVRLDRTTQYSRASNVSALLLIADALEYWVRRFRGG